MRPWDRHSVATKQHVPLASLFFLPTDHLRGVGARCPERG